MSPLRNSGTLSRPPNSIRYCIVASAWRLMKSFDRRTFSPSLSGSPESDFSVHGCCVSEMKTKSCSAGSAAATGKDNAQERVADRNQRALACAGGKGKLKFMAALRVEYRRSDTCSAGNAVGEVHAAPGESGPAARCVAVLRAASVVARHERPGCCGFLRTFQKAQKKMGSQGSPFCPAWRDRVRSWRGRRPSTGSRLR